MISVVVPYEIAGRTSVKVSVECGVLTSVPITLKVAPASPGIFTLDPSGKGGALAVNEDGTINSSVYRAPRGSIVAFYLTGTGPTSPGSRTGSVTGNHPEEAALPVSAFIDGKTAEVRYAGAAPGLVSGVTQVNVLIPMDTKPGAAPVLFRFGTAHTQDQVTIAVK